MNALPQEAVDAARAVRKALPGWGVEKTLEEIVVRKGLSWTPTASPSTPTSR
jgi:hypothetical protein